MPAGGDGASGCFAAVAGADAGSAAFDSSHAGAQTSRARAQQRGTARERRRVNACIAGVDRDASELISVSAQTSRRGCVGDSCPPFGSRSGAPVKLSNMSHPIEALLFAFTLGTTPCGESSAQAETSAP